MPSVLFEPAIPAIDRPQIYALDCSATGTVSATLLPLHVPRTLKEPSY